MRPDEGTRGVPHRYDKLVHTIPHDVRHVIRKRHLPTFVRKPGLNPVHEHVRTEVALLEVEQQMLTLRYIAVEHAPVPKRLLRLQQTPHSRQRTLQRKRHKNLPVPRGRDLWDILGNRVVPEAIEVRPARPHHLRTRIFAPGIFRRDLLAPFGKHRRHISSCGLRRTPHGSCATTVNARLHRCKSRGVRTDHRHDHDANKLSHCPSPIVYFGCIISHG